MTEDPLQVDLQDHDLLDEVQLTAALMVAANECEGDLSDGEIDELLGLGDRSFVLPRAESA
ncbi:hypothetical protein GCM10011519_17270 [Marmoricola endophyticus]|uniref:Uncharacterized protein n=1 Tax=Marmoricola endophyticus TaxID=2040280 RepID=A0A917BI27_9ACTN|nr:hypothetical protein [Marmoricola endophyticus]GGF43983.1 hypothetical protein GCM10011519_17270 [Marmoricola endophyticus]